MTEGTAADSVLAEARPPTPTEAIVARAWADELRLDRVGLDEDFIDLGSHSLRGLAVAARLEERFGVAIPARVLFEEPTVADLAAWIDRHRAAAAGTVSPVRVHQGAGRRPVFAVPGGRGDESKLFSLAKLARRSDELRPMYAFVGDPPVPSHIADDAWVAAAAPMLTAGMRAVQPEGPYLLLGVCIGGIIAWEMAHRLEAEGEAVRLFLVDTRNARVSVGEEAFRTQVARAMTRDETRAHRRERREWRQRREAAGLPTRPPPLEEGGKLRALVAKSYVPKPLRGPVTLVVNEYWHRISPDLGWADLLGDRLRVSVTDGAHGPEWNEPRIAARLRDWLREADPDVVEREVAQEIRASMGDGA